MREKIILKFFALIAFSIVVLNGASAATVSFTGSCVPSGSWVVVITINGNGQVTGREGVDCHGGHWIDSCPGAIRPRYADYFRALGNGAWVTASISEDGNLVGLKGKDQFGNLWNMDISTGQVIIQ